MRLPNTLTICGHKIKVAMEHIDGDTLGECKVDERKIIISPAVATNPDLAVSTLFHEAVHMTVELGGIAYGWTNEKEEAFTRCIEYNLLPLIPKFAALLAAAKEEKKRRKK